MNQRASLATSLAALRFDPIDLRTGRNRPRTIPRRNPDQFESNPVDLRLLAEGESLDSRRRGRFAVGIRPNAIMNLESMVKRATHAIFLRPKQPCRSRIAGSWTRRLSFHGIYTLEGPKRVAPIAGYFSNRLRGVQEGRTDRRSLGLRELSPVIPLSRMAEPAATAAVRARRFRRSWGQPAQNSPIATDISFAPRFLARFFTPSQLGRQVATQYGEHVPGSASIARIDSRHACGQPRRPPGTGLPARGRRRK